VAHDYDPFNFAAIPSGPPQSAFRARSVLAAARPQSRRFEADAMIFRGIPADRAAISPSSSSMLKQTLLS